MSIHLRQAWAERIRKQAGGGTIYRGFQVPLPKDLADQVGALLQPAMEMDQYEQHLKIGPLILGFLGSGYDDGYGNVGLGRHWTTDRHMAEIATTHGMVGVNGWGVILTAVYDDTDVDPALTGTTDYMARSESEVTIKPGARLTITDVEIPEGALAYSFISVLRTPMQAAAAKQASVFTFDVGYATDKDSLKAGEVQAGTRRVTIEADTESEASLLANQMVAATGNEPTSLVRVAAGSWRGLSYEQPFWTQYDACIIPNRAARSSYEVYDHGRLVASRPSLAEAKAVLGADLPWRIERLPKEVAIHVFYGLTDEFSDPTSIYVVDHRG